MKWKSLVVVTLMLSGCADPNAVPAYENSFPSNCRALIAEGIKGWRLGHYTPEETLGSIDRNCGINGHLWNN